MKSKLYVLTILSIWASLYFFNPFNALSEKTGKFIYYFLSLCILFIAYKRKTVFKKDVFLGVYAVLMIGICFSTIMPTFSSQNQHFFITLQATLPFIFGYLLFFITLKLDLPLQRIEKAMLILGFFSMFVFAINFITAPHYVFGAEADNLDISRGVTRIRTPMSYIFFIYFYGINKWLNTENRKWLYVVLLSLFFIILSVTRQNIMLSMVLGFFFLIKKIRWQKKVAVVLLTFLFAQFILPQIPLYNHLQQLTTEQRMKNEEEDDIRIRAYHFYTIELQANELTPYLGNGVPSFGNSPWGNHVDKTTQFNRCFAADIGWGGFYYYFGLVTTLTLASLFMIAIFIRKKKEYEYTSYILIMIALKAFVSGPILYNQEIVFLMLIFYIVYTQKRISACHIPAKQHLKGTHNQLYYEIHRTYYPQLQQL